MVTAAAKHETSKNQRQGSADIYYDFGPILSRNPLIAMVVGGRGMGKTYGAKRIALRDYVRNGNQFVYLRRFKTEIKHFKTFMNDIAHEFPQFEWRVQGNEVQCKQGDRWDTAGYAIALSTMATTKSASFPRVRYVIFDEFMMNKGFLRYIPDEVTVFLDMVNTIDRNEDRVTVIMTANAADIANPYFLEWNIFPHLGEMRRYKDGSIVVDFPSADKYAAFAKQSRLGKLIDGSEYEKYAVGNYFVGGLTKYIARKPHDAIYGFSIEHEGSSVSVWLDDDMRNWYVQARQPKNPTMYALTIKDHSDSPVLASNDFYVQKMRSAYRNREMFFDSQQTHASFQSMLAFMATK